MRRLTLVDPDPSWPERFEQIAEALREQLGEDALRIDHIGSTAVPGLVAKDVIDVQVTVADLAVGDRWPDELLPGLYRRTDHVDHIPAGHEADPADWAKRYWSDGDGLHVHVRAVGTPNQRYALLFRDYLRADPATAAAYGALKRALSAAAPDDFDAYYAVKDPACDLIIAAAEHWAEVVDWQP